MNLCDAYVESINSLPYEEYSKWWINVSYVSWGGYSTATLMFDTKEEVDKVDVGFQFLV